MFDLIAAFSLVIFPKTLPPHYNLNILYLNNEDTFLTLYFLDNKMPEHQNRLFLLPDINLF